MAAPQAWSGWVVGAVPPHWTSQVSSIPWEEPKCEVTGSHYSFTICVKLCYRVVLGAETNCSTGEESMGVSSNHPKACFMAFLIYIIDVIFLCTTCLPRDSWHPYWRPPPQSHCLPRSQTCTCTPEWAEPWPGGGSTGAGAGGWPPRPCLVASSLRSPGPEQARADCYVTPHYDHIMASGLQAGHLSVCGYHWQPGTSG